MTKVQADTVQANAAAPGDGIPPGGPPYRINYTVSLDGLVDAARLAHSGTRNRILLLAAAGAVVGLAFLVLAPTGSGLLLVFFGVAMTLLLVLRAPERWYVGRRAGNVIGTPVRLVVDVDGIEATTPAASGRLAWSGLTDVRADDRSVVFLGGRVLASWAPADALGSPERREEIVAYARARIATTREQA